MDVREKLTHILTSEPELLKNLNISARKVFQLVDKMITNGVTVQDWVSVEERLPDVGLDVLFVCENKSYGVGAYSDTYRDFFIGQFPVKNVTHWMPLPQPPKGE